MSTLLVVGNSFHLIDSLSQSFRDNPQEKRILFATESVLPYKRELLPQWLVKDIKESALHEYVGTWLKEHHVEVIAGETISRISTKRNYLTCESKKQIEFDKAILGDSGQYIVSTIKGHQKQGVYNALTYTAVKDILKNLLFMDSLFVRVTSIHGLNMACALARLKKDVNVVVPQGLTFNIFDEETAALLKQLLESAQMRVFSEDIVEILGDQQVKAVKLANGKVIAAQGVVVDEVQVDWRCLTDQQVLSHIVRQEDPFLQPLTLPLKPMKFGDGIVNGFAYGVTILPEGGREYLKFDGPQNIFKKIFIYQDKLVGAVCFNAPNQIAELSQLIDSGEPITGREETLLEG